MRIIKLSPSDPDMLTRKMVDDFFINYLPSRERFYVRKGLISKSNFVAGERLVFSYKTEIIYIARAKSGILDTESDNPNAPSYPNFFLVDPHTITHATGRLGSLEAELAKLGITKRITVQGWPHIVFPSHLEGQGRAEGVKP